MINLKTLEVWFVTGSQNLYGEETLKQVATHSQQIVKELDASPLIPVQVIFKPVLKTPEEIFSLVSGSKYFQKLHWYRCLDAYVLAG